MTTHSSTRHFHDGWDDLAAAIIIRAVEDYRQIRSQMQKEPENAEQSEQKAEIEDFFLSNWFGVLTSLSGGLLLQRLQNEDIRMEVEE